MITIHQRYRQTDRQTTCDRNTALCTKVHRAVKNDGNLKNMLMHSLHYNVIDIYVKITRLNENTNPHQSPVLVMPWAELVKKSTDCDVSQFYYAIVRWELEVKDTRLIPSRASVLICLMVNYSRYASKTRKSKATRVTSQSLYNHREKGRSYQKTATEGAVIWQINVCFSFWLRKLD